MGAAQSFSKIKLPRSTQASAEAAKRRAQGWSLVVKIGQAAWSRPRLFIHAGVIVGLCALVMTSGLGSSGTAALHLSSGGVVSSLDSVSTATVAAEIAQKANFMIAADAAKKATTLSSQITLPTDGQAVLASNQIVETSGANARTVHAYTVQPGDTISQIGARFGITTDTIRWANNLSDDNLTPGSDLTILPVSGVLYTVQDGDSAASIASTYQANATQIVSFNNLEAKGLKSGQKIIIPDGVMPQAAQPTTPVYQTASSAPSLTNFIGGANMYDFGYCTYYVASRRSVGNWGNAVNWYQAAQNSGFKVGSTPEPGAIAWTGAGYAGHVAYVESVHGSSVTISEMNYSGWDVVDYRTVPASSFLYIY